MAQYMYSTKAQRNSSWQASMRNALSIIFLDSYDHSIYIYILCTYNGHSRVENVLYYKHNEMPSLANHMNRRGYEEEGNKWVY